MPVMRDDVRPLGVVYTPPVVAAPMVRLALAPLIAGRTVDELLALRICDPAIGEGAFLVEVVELLAAAIVAASRSERGHAISDRDGRAIAIDDARQQVAARCIAGVDIDRRAVEAARAATGAPASALRVGDALAIDWTSEFPEVFERGGGFDAVVGNPPYIRQERLANKHVLRSFESYHGAADLYVYFIELAHRLLRPNGRFCLIVPTKWLTVAYGEALRALLAKRTSVDGVADLSRSPLFADADAFPCIVWGTATRHRETPVRAVQAHADTPVAEALGRGGELIPRSRWRAAPWHLDGGSERALLERLEREFPPLRERGLGRPARGVVTGCNRAFVIDGATRARLIDAEPRAAALIRPFVKGRDIRPWRIENSERYILLIDRGTSLDDLPVVLAHLEAFRVALEPRPSNVSGTWSGRKPGSYLWHELQDPVGPLVKARTPRLLYQDIQTAPACVLDQEGDAVPDTTVWMLPTDDRFVLAVLNSRLYGWYARRRFPPALNGAVRPKLAYLTALPLPILSVADLAAISTLTTSPAKAGARLEALVAEAYRLSATERALLAS